MRWRQGLLWLGVAVAAFVLGTAMTFARTIDVSWLVFMPLGLAGAIGAYFLGVRKAAAASLRSRMLSGGLWAAPWIVFLLLPWGLVEGGRAWERAEPVVPPDAVPFSPGFLPDADGFSFAFTSGASWPAIEQHYRERLARRGWRHEWTREFLTMPAGAPVGSRLPRWSLYRRFEGLVLVSVGTLSDGRTLVVSDYMHLRRRFDAGHLLRE